MVGVQGRWSLGVHGVVPAVGPRRSRSPVLEPVRWQAYEAAYAEDMAHVQRNETASQTSRAEASSRGRKQTSARNNAFR